MYIFSYQGKIPKTELTFNPNYEFSFDAANNTLTIRKSDKPLPKDFWGEGIYSVTALLGNNGVGKSTVMSAIMEATVEGNGAKGDIDAILVYENDNGTLQYYCNKNRKCTINRLGNLIIEEIDEPEPISLFYYTGHFSPNVNDDIRWQDVVGLYNASDSSMLVQDYGTDKSEVDESMQSSLNDYLLAHVAQNHIRICELLSEKKARDLLNNLLGLQAPDYLLLRPKVLYSGDSSNKNIKEAEKSTIKQPNSAEPKEEAKDARDCLNAAFIIQGFQNCIFEEQRLVKELSGKGVPIIIPIEGKKLLTKWERVVERKNGESILSLFENFVEELSSSESSRSRAQYRYPYVSKLRFLADLLKHLNDEKNDVERCEHYYYYPFAKKSDNIKKLLALNTASSPISFFINFSYSKTIESNNPTLLSSGELAILNIFSRLYDAIVARPIEFDGVYSPTLLLLDEAELGLHPEWQRQYINVLLQFLQFLSKNEKHSFQIVLASHSPILLSDIPRACSNYLGTNEKMEETFASNIFELYRNSFFMKDGMMGAFAEEKVQSLLNRIQNKRRKMNDKVIKGIENEIEMIGDERIRLYLLHEMEKRVDQPLRNVLIAYYTEKIKQLKKGIES